MNFLQTLLIIFLASTSIFRIDFGLNKTGFIFTPTLLLSIIMASAFPVYILLNRKIELPKNFQYFIFILTLFFLWLLFSIIPYQDFIQFKRLILFSIIIISMALFFIYFRKVDQLEVLNKFIHYSIIIYTLFAVVEGYLYFIGQYFRKEESLLFAFINLNPNTFGFNVPRLSGGFLDPNIGAYFLTYLYLLIQHFKIQRKKIWLISILILFTFSRSAITAYLLLVFLSFLYNYFIRNEKLNLRLHIPIGPLLKSSFLVILILTTLILISFHSNFWGNLGESILGRITHKDESANIHFDLIRLALYKIFLTPYHFFLGYGFGSSFLYTQLYFPGDKYGNFHSEYLTFFFETGFIGLMIYFILLVTPVFIFILNGSLTKNFFLALMIVAFMLHNIFYQQFLFQYFWIFIGFIWYFSNKNEVGGKNA